MLQILEKSFVNKTEVFYFDLKGETVDTASEYESDTVEHLVQAN